MTNLEGIMNFTQWPRDVEGNPLLTCSEDAHFYAKLISQNGDECFNILRLRCLSLFHLENFRCKDDPNLDDMMNLAVQAQFYRECLEEVRRIRIDHKDV